MLNTKTLLTAAMIVGMGASVTACNTVEGAGQDIEHAGESVQDAAE
ncbi:MAG: entericidin A/B family lipoprotein [Alphaproteobacteria bacterium]|nr:entericidin A/B family lipoprotein [Alphaproteobacteria bacterium]